MSAVEYHTNKSGPSETMSFRAKAYSLPTEYLYNGTMNLLCASRAGPIITRHLLLAHITHHDQLLCCCLYSVHPGSTSTALPHSSFRGVVGIY